MEKDFGYLFPFFDKVAAAASGLEPRARAELEALISGERARWERARALLGGATPEAAPAAPKSGPGFTVGSLKASR